MRSLAPKYIEVHLISDAFTYPVNLKDDDVVRPAGFGSHSFSIHVRTTWRSQSPVWVLLCKINE